jgi:LysR family transcriptional regulator, transcriptional activator of nhaA
MYTGSMEWLNYHHLLYFWTVAKEGSIARACEKLRLAQPTISGQLRLLEDTLGEKLFFKQGRGLAMTEVGQVVYRYAEEIFGLGRELQDVLKGRPRGRPLRLLAGVSDLIPKLIAYRVLRPALEMPEPVQIICDEGPPQHLLAELAEHRMDVVLSDAPIPPTVPVKAYNHLLGTSTASIFAAPPLAGRYRKNFPACLDGAPFLLPMHESSLRRPLEQWFDSEKIRPAVIGEFKDRALMTTFGQAGAGVFAAPTAIEKEICEQYRVVSIGRVDSIVERFYAISAERKLKHPAVVTISEAAREKLFANHASPS